MTVNGREVVTGTDLDDGDSIIVGNLSDYTLGRPLGYDFALLDQGLIECDFFAFSKTGADTVAGLEFTLPTTAIGSCGDILGTGNTMSGTRTERAAADHQESNLANQMGQLTAALPTGSAYIGPEVLVGLKAVLENVQRGTAIPAEVGAPPLQADRSK
jgi:hypothetical protein